MLLNWKSWFIGYSVESLFLLLLNLLFLIETEIIGEYSWQKEDESTVDLKESLKLYDILDTTVQTLKIFFVDKHVSVHHAKIQKTTFVEIDLQKT